jgi:hypothetical protein
VSYNAADLVLLFMRYKPVDKTFATFLQKTCLKKEIFWRLTKDYNTDPSYTILGGTLTWN